MSGYYIHRKRLIERLTSLMQDEVNAGSSEDGMRRMVFITGPEGMGKLGLARSYAMSADQDYDRVITLPCLPDEKPDLYRMLLVHNSLHPEDIITIRDIYLADRRTLLIISHFTGIEPDDFMEQLAQNTGQARLLVLSDHNEIYQYPYAWISYLNLMEEDTGEQADFAFQLFLSRYTMNPLMTDDAEPARDLTEDEQVLIRRILACCGNNAAAATILGTYMREYANIKPARIYEYLASEITPLDDTKQIVFKLFNLLFLFSAFSLSPADCRILTVLALLPGCRIDRVFLMALLTGSSKAYDTDDLRYSIQILSNLEWIQASARYVYIHPLINQYLAGFYQTSPDLYREFLTSWLLHDTCDNNQYLIERILQKAEIGLWAGRFKLVCDLLIQEASSQQRLSRFCMSEGPFLLAFGDQLSLQTMSLSRRFLAYDLLTGMEYPLLDLASGMDFRQVLAFNGEKIPWEKKSSASETEADNPFNPDMQGIANVQDSADTEGTANVQDGTDMHSTAEGQTSARGQRVTAAQRIHLLQLTLSSHTYDLVFPTDLLGCPIMQIPDWFCANNSAITGLILPAGLRTIGHHAFFLCSNMGGPLVIPEAVDTIGAFAFSFCGITQVEFSKVRTKYGSYIFSGCRRLNEVIIPKKMDVIPTGIFSRSGLSAIDLPETVTEIGDHAFEFCLLGGQLKLPDSIRQIGDYAFMGNRFLSGEVNLPASLEVMGEGIFAGCDRLEGSWIEPEADANTPLT